MEKDEATCLITPNNLFLHPEQDYIRLSVKNISLRSTYYEVLLSDGEHFRMMSDRTFTLAPGMTKVVKVEHLRTIKCRSVEAILYIVDTNGLRHPVTIRCKEDDPQEPPKIEMPHEISIEKAKINDERSIEIPITNMTLNNLKVRVRIEMPDDEEDVVSVKIFEHSFILLGNGRKLIRGIIRFLKESQFDVRVVFCFTEQGGRERWNEYVMISGNSLLKSQYIADQQGTKIELVSHDILNGLSVNGTLSLINNYHLPCPYKLHEVIEITDYASYCRKLQEFSLTMEKRQGVIEPNSTVEVPYTLTTKPNQNDLSFTHRYSQIAFKDEMNASKLRNSTFFKKIVQVHLRAQFGQDNASNFRFRGFVTNPALRFIRRKDERGESYDINNDTLLSIPYKFGHNIGFAIKQPTGKLLPGLNVIEFEGRSKENLGEGLKGVVKMDIPYSEIVLFEPLKMQRPRSALLLPNNNGGREGLKERISLRAPSKKGQIGIKAYKVVSQTDFLPKLGRFCKGEEPKDDELKYLQVNRNEKGNVLTNSHPNKHFVAHFIDKGHLLMDSQCSYLIPFERRGLRFELAGRLFTIHAKENEDRQPYKVLSRQLLFCFGYDQKDFQVVKSVEVANRSDEPLTMYCLSLDEENFHSIEHQHLVIIPPNTTGSYRISFSPQSEVKPRDNKIMRKIEFLIGGNKEVVTCLGDLLSADVTMNEKHLKFSNCSYSTEEIKKELRLSNRGLNKVHYRIEHSNLISITPKNGIITEKSIQNLTLSFVPGKINRAHREDIKIYLKGAYLLTVPLEISTLLPSISCSTDPLYFGSGLLDQTLKVKLPITNNNSYHCNFLLHFPSRLKGSSQLSIAPGKTEIVTVSLAVDRLGVQSFDLPADFIELCGYGPIDAPKIFKYQGKRTLLQFIPQNPFSDLVFSKVQETTSFRMKNLSKELIRLSLVLTPKQSQQLIILSCEPTNNEIEPGEEREFKLRSIRVDRDDPHSGPNVYSYNLLFLLNKQTRYCSIDFDVTIPPPQLEIQPKEVYFPITSVGCWSRSSFKVVNKGYKQVILAFKKPANISFEFNHRLDEQNVLTTLNSEAEVAVMFKSKKTTSFAVMMEVLDNYGKKYQVRLFGTASVSPLLNCERMLHSSNKAGTSSQCSSTTSMKSLPNLQLGTVPSGEEPDNLRFINRWLSGVLHEFARDSEVFNVWLKNPRNFLTLIQYFRCEGALPSPQSATLEVIMTELKKNGYPIYTCKLSSLMTGGQQDWLTLLWLVMSQKIVHEECLKWVNKVCKINLEMYDSAFNHRRKILMDLLSKLLEPIFRGKSIQWQKLVDLIEPSLPFISRIQNKRQFVLTLNLLYHKFNKIEKQKLKLTSFTMPVELPCSPGESVTHWMLGSNNFTVNTGSNCLNPKINEEKHLFSCRIKEPEKAVIETKEDLVLGVWSTSIFEPFRLYEIELIKQPPIIHPVTIECLQKCSQEWRLDFPCKFESEYFFEFTGDREFKCQMPDIGVIKSGEVMEFRVLYSPGNLKEHKGVLKIANKYEENLFQVRGRPIRSSVIEMQQVFKVQEGQRHVETFSLPEDPNISSDQVSYSAIQLAQRSDQLVLCEAKSNKKEVIVQVGLEFKRLVQNKQMVIQVSNQDGSYCKNVRLIISVIPKPTVIKAQLKGKIDQMTLEKIPIINTLSIKQSCFVSFKMITQEQYQSVNTSVVAAEDTPFMSDTNEGELKISATGKLQLKPKERYNLHLNYLPTSLSENYCQIRVRMHASDALVVYYFKGIPELPCTQNTPMFIQCQKEVETIHKIKIPNRIKQKVDLQVETSLPCVSGPEKIVIPGKETHTYYFKVFCLHEGDFQGQIVFKNEKFQLNYPLRIEVQSKKKVRKIRIESKVRITSNIQIELANRADQDVQYEVKCNSPYISFDPICQVPANRQGILELHYTPLFTGVKNTQLTLYNEKMHEICYNLEMVSEEEKQEHKFMCGLCDSKKFKLNIRNTTGIKSTIQEPNLPPQLTLMNSQCFPLNLGPYQKTHIDLCYKAQVLQKQKKIDLTLMSPEIGKFHYTLLFFTQDSKMMPENIVHYDNEDDFETTTKETQLQFINCFNEQLDFKLAKNQIKLNSCAELTVQSPPVITLKPFEKKILKCTILIKNGMVDPKETNHESQCVHLTCGEFVWSFPVEAIRVYKMRSTIDLSGMTHEMQRSRVSLKKVKNIKDWEVSDLPDFRDYLNLSFITGKEVYVQALVNKHFDFHGSVTFYDEHRPIAEQYPLSVVIAGKKYEKINISSNVGSIGRAEIRLKKGSGRFKATLKNNKSKEFGVVPMEGAFNEKGDTLVVFEYRPVEYNGNKKAEVTISSEYGVFNFVLNGKFPKK